jgi:hypothetical protein
MSAVPLFCSVEYGCARWSCSRGYLYELLAAAKIRAVMDGRRTKIETASGDAYFSSLPEFSTRPKDRGPKRKQKAASALAAAPRTEVPSIRTLWKLTFQPFHGGRAYSLSPR